MPGFSQTPMVKLVNDTARFTKIQENLPPTGHLRYRISQKGMNCQLAISDTTPMLGPGDINLLALEIIVVFA